MNPNLSAMNRAQIAVALMLSVYTLTVMAFASLVVTGRLAPNNNPLHPVTLAE